MNFVVQPLVILEERKKKVGKKKGAGRGWAGQIRGKKKKIRCPNMCNTLALSIVSK